MTKWILRLALVAGLVIGGVWAWRALFPGPEQIIKRRLAQLAQTASTTGDEGLLAKAAKVQKLTTFFTPDVEIVIDIPGQYNADISGVDELTRMAASARSMGKAIKLKFLDVAVDVGPDHNSADAHMVGEANVSGERNVQVQELKAHWRRVDREWLIDRVETVRTLH